jgi:hypothetical protein
VPSRAKNVSSPASPPNSSRPPPPVMRSAPREPQRLLRRRLNRCTSSSRSRSSRRRRRRKRRSLSDSLTGTSRRAKPPSMPPGQRSVSARLPMVARQTGWRASVKPTGADELNSRPNSHRSIRGWRGAASGTSSPTSGHVWNHKPRRFAPNWPKQKRFGRSVTANWPCFVQIRPCTDNPSRTTSLQPRPDEKELTRSCKC